MSSVRTHRHSETGSRHTSISRVHRNSKNKQPDQEIIWPEWSDADTNSEKWGLPLDPIKPAGKGKKESKKEKKVKGSTKTAPTAVTKSTLPEVDQFEDPYPVSLPWSLHHGVQFSWKRPSVVFPDLRLVIYSQGTNVCPDLVSSNRELLHSEFIRSFMSAVHILTYVGYKFPFIVEWQTSQFTASTDNVPWKPWHHIYSLCRAGGSEGHAPAANNLGKYVVRLYWLGCWRKILLDDRFPVDVTGRTLLPTSTTGNDKELELWPVLLTKALMKIASLTWSDKEDIVDFDIITCLTGWTVQKIQTKDLDVMDIWEVLCGYSDHFTWDKKMLKEEPIDDKKKETSEKGSKKDKKSKKSKDSKGSKATNVSTTDLVTTPSFHLVASCTDLSLFHENDIDDLTPCFSHQFLVEQTRSIPLVKTVEDILTELKAWKLYRWLDWAMQHGLWDPDYTLENKLFLKIVSNLRKVDENITYDLETTYKAKCINVAADAFKAFLDLRATEKQGKAKKGGGSPKKEKKEKKSPKSPKSPKSGKTLEQFIDPSVWCYFINIGRYINEINVYLKPSSFKSRFIVSDIKMSGAPDMKSKKPAKKDDKKTKGSSAPADPDSVLKYIKWDNTFLATRNEPLYMFTDSINIKLTMFTLSHIGNIFPEKELKHVDVPPIECIKQICLSGKCIDKCICQKKNELQNIVFVDTRKSANVIVEDFFWTNREIGDMNVFVNTLGTTCVLTNLPKGRFLKRLWLNVNTPYVLQIFCDDSSLKVGKIDEIIEHLSSESELLMKTCYDVCSAFGNLVRYFATPDYPAALRAFYKSYLPIVLLSKKQFERIHDSFLEELIKILANIYNEDHYYNISRAIRVLLLNPNFRIPYIPTYSLYNPQFPLVDEDCFCVEVDDMREKKRERAAIKIQSLFKMLHMKRIKALHNPNHPKLNVIIEGIKSVYMEVFSSKTREMQCLLLLRSLILNKNIEDIAKYFSYYNDMNSVADVKQFSGEIVDLVPIRWIPLLRRQFFCHNTVPIFIRAYIFCSLPSYLLQIFNNDTGAEMERHINNTLVCKYEKNQKGYTILAYGYTNENPVKICNWKLHLVIQKRLVICPVDIDTNANAIYQVQGHYLPNLNNLICKTSVKVQQHTVGTFHLQTSSNTAKIKIQCLTQQGDILYEGYGLSKAIIPVVNLCRQTSETSILEDNQRAGSIFSVKYSKSARKTKMSRRISSVKSLHSKDKKGFRSLDKDPDIQSDNIKKQLVTINEDSFANLYTEFIIKAYILDDSWPLTIKEWETVKKLRTLSSVESEMLHQNQKQIFRALTVLKNAPKKSILKGRKHSSKLQDLPTEKPFWVLTSLNDVGNNITVENDYSRLDDIKEEKRHFMFPDPERYFLGKDFRQNFLQRSYLPYFTPVNSIEECSVQSFTLQNNFGEEQDIEIEITNYSDHNNSQASDSKLDEKFICPECQKDINPEEFEYIKPPDSLHKMLPPFEINKYDLNKVEYRWPVSEEREREILADIDNSIETFENNYSNYLSDMNEYLEKTRDKYLFFRYWYDDIRKDSSKIMQQSEIRREAYINKMNEAKLEEAAGKKTETKKKKK